MVFAVVTGGGTSGHFIPAQAILESLMESGIDSSELRYVGSRRGVEQSLMNGSPIKAEYLPISGLQRSLSLKGIARNLVLPVRLLRLPRGAGYDMEILPPLTGLNSTPPPDLLQAVTLVNQCIELLDEVGVQRVQGAGPGGVVAR